MTDVEAITVEYNEATGKPGFRGMTKADMLVFGLLTSDELVKGRSLKIPFNEGANAMVLKSGDKVIVRDPDDWTIFRKVTFKDLPLDAVYVDQGIGPKGTHIFKERAL